jgi:hypothetical protein
VNSRNQLNIPASILPLVLSQTFVEDAVKLLVTRFIPLEEADLQGWEADPEEWVNLEEKDNEQWEYELRVSIAGVFPGLRLCHL